MIINQIELSQKLINIPSYSGHNPEVINFLKKILEDLGFTCKILEFDGNNSYKVNNLHAIYNPNNSLKTLYFAGHTDVVKEGDVSLWKYPPFEAKIVEGKLYGRGACDMKCAIASFVASVSEFLSYNKNPQYGIGFLITNDEESDGVNGTKKVLEWMADNNLPITYCLVGEPTNPLKFGEMIKVGRRGSIGFKVKIIGKQGHVAYPEIALNPITTIINLFKVLKDHKLDNGTKFFDPSNLEFTHIESQNLGSNVIPNEAWGSFNVRFNDTHNAQDIIDFVEYACQKVAGGSGSFSAQYKIEHRLSGESFLSTPKELAKITANAVKKITNINTILSTTGGTSDARFIKDYAQVVEIGLVNETAHKIDEFALVEEINQLQKVYLEILNTIF
jgi:succinyl-diaminopimelate desuccinylase